MTDTTTHFPVRRARGETVTEIANGATRQTRALPLDAGGLAVVFAVLMFAAIFALRLSVSTSETTGLFLLFVIPIAAITLAHGSPAGAAAAALALGLVFLRSDLQHVHMDALGYTTRGMTFFTIPLVMWLAGMESARGGQTEQSTRSQPARNELTRRELEVLRLLADGHTNAEIAEQLVLSVRTIESHRASLRRKLGRPSRSELRRYALQRGLVSGDVAA